VNREREDGASHEICSSTPTNSVGRAPHRTLDIGRSVDCERHLARSEQLVELGFALDDVGDLEIFGVLEALRIERPMSLRSYKQYRGRQNAESPTQRRDNPSPLQASTKFASSPEPFSLQALEPPGDPCAMTLTW
jgi:hypothetical protein